MSYDTSKWVKDSFFLFNKHAFPRSLSAWLLKHTPLTIPKYIQSYNIVQRPQKQTDFSGWQS